MGGTACAYAQLIAECGCVTEVPTHRNSSSMVLFSLHTSEHSYAFSILNNPKAFSFRINILRLALKHENVGKEGTVDSRYKSTRLQVYDDYGKGVNHTKRNHGKLEKLSTLRA